jgi:HPt (histidine-containing phosphotransfer) domain-containing protein
MKLTFVTGKYRDLLFAILLFIVLDLGILFFNFYASLQLERDASRINSAGELRTLTQQMTKSLLTLQVERKADLPIQTSMAQLNQGHAGFINALTALKDSLSQDIEFTLFGLDPATLRDAVGRVEKEWGPLDESIRQVIATNEPTLDDTEIAVNKAVARNIRLMGFANDLAQGVELAANTKTNRMRQIQVAAIVLALLNFIYIVFKFLRRLNTSDRIAEAARRETEDILNTVTEGLLLVRADGTVGTQFSNSIHSLFMREIKPGENFNDILKTMLSPERAAEAESFLSLLFDPKVKPALLSQLDPLKDVAIYPTNALTGTQRYLSFQMTQVKEGAVIKELLVTVFDVTQRISLERELAVTQDAAKSDVEDLIKVLEHEPVLLQDFLVNTRARLADLNQAMRDVGRTPVAYADLVEEAMRNIHGVKGEGAALSLSAVSRQAHAMENVLVPLRNRKDLTGTDLIPVVFELSKVQEQIDLLYRVFERLGRFSRETGNDSNGVMSAMVGNLRSLSERIADSLGKKVRLTAHVADMALPDGVTKVLSEALPQLVRNAVVHGIETPEARLRLGKPEMGELKLEVGQRQGGLIEVILSDDGRGIQVPTVRQRAEQLHGDMNRYTDSQVLAMIFDPRFSTATEVTEHAGRGVGLALVKQIVQKAGVKLRVMTQPSSYTRFILQFSATP